MEARKTHNGGFEVLHNPALMQRSRAKNLECVFKTATIKNAFDEII